MHPISPLPNFDAIDVEALSVRARELGAKVEVLKEEMKDVSAELRYIAQLHACGLFPKSTNTMDSRIQALQFLKQLFALREDYISAEACNRRISQLRGKVS